MAARLHTVTGMKKVLVPTAVCAVVTSVAVAATDQPATAAGAVRITRLQYDSPGADTGSNSSRNAEWVRITNNGAKARVLTGWRLRDKPGHVYQFPTFKLKPGKSVRVRTGKGSNTGADL